MHIALFNFFFARGQKYGNPQKKLEWHSTVDPMDSATYWVAGVGVDNPLLLNGSWSGQNKLGQIWMAVREQFVTHH